MLWDLLQLNPHRANMQISGLCAPYALVKGQHSGLHRAYTAEATNRRTCPTPDLLIFLQKPKSVIIPPSMGAGIFSWRCSRHVFESRGLRLLLTTSADAPRPSPTHDNDI